MKTGIKLIVLMAVLLVNSAFAAQDTIIPIYKTNTPMQQLGFDVSADQTVGVRFSPVEDVTLKTIELWFMNNSSQQQSEVRITLRNDKKDKNHQSMPGNEVLESWTFQISSLGWNIEKEVLTSKLQTELKHNQRYWLVAESYAPARNNPVWSIAESEGENISLGFGGSYNRVQNKWDSLGYSAIPNLLILGELPENGSQKDPTPK